MESKTTHTEQDSNTWQYVIGIKAYRRAIRREHNARNRNACPWCESIATIPYSEAGSSQATTERLCENCLLIFTPSADVPPVINRH